MNTQINRRFNSHDVQDCASTLGVGNVEAKRILEKKAVLEAIEALPDSEIKEIVFWLFREATRGWNPQIERASRNGCSSEAGAIPAGSTR